MQHTGIKIFLIVLGFLWIPTVSLSLPNCPSDQTKRYQNCFGTYISTNDPGYKYVGEWRDDKRHGQGASTWSAPHPSAGEKYVGEYKNNEKYGVWKYFTKEGFLERTETWEDGVKQFVFFHK